MILEEISVYLNKFCLSLAPEPALTVLTAQLPDLPFQFDTNLI